MNLFLLLLVASWVLFAAVFIIIVISRSEGRRNYKTLADTGKLLSRVEVISEQVDNLSRIFLVPHARGGLGETLLELLLANWLPEKSYSLQYRFKNGYRADAVINLGAYKVAVDSKFPLESIKRSIETDSGPDTPFHLTNEIKRTLLKHGKDIAEKYIQPEEGTLNFALMYIPSEMVYYRSFVENSEISDELVKTGIIPVSPSSLFLYLQTAAYGLKGFMFQQNVRETMDLINQLTKEARELKKTLAVSGSHLSNLYKSYDSVSTGFRRLEEAVEKLNSR